jgi:hypothetical protein
VTVPPEKKGDAEKKAEAAPAPDKKDDAGSGAPAELTIRQSETTVVVTEKPGATREYYPNGRTYKADEGQSDVRSQWRGGQLVYEKRSQRGWKVSESWQIAPDRSRLTVEVRASGGGQQKVAVKRVYDRVTEPAP